MRDPLAFVMVSLSDENIPTNDDINRERNVPSKEQTPTCALFYSIVAPHKGRSSIFLSTRIDGLASRINFAERDHSPSSTRLSHDGEIPYFFPHSWICQMAQGGSG